MVSPADVLQGMEYDRYFSKIHLGMGNSQIPTVKKIFRRQPCDNKFEFLRMLFGIMISAALDPRHEDARERDGPYGGLRKQFMVHTPTTQSTSLVIGSNGEQSASRMRTWRKFGLRQNPRPRRGWRTMKLVSSACNLVVLAYLLLPLALVCAQSIEDEFSSPCTSAKTCGQCMRISPMCAWCGEEGFPRSLPRCDILLNLEKVCNVKNITNPELTFKKTKNDAWTSGGLDSPPIQVKPQEMEYTLRPNEPVNFKLKFRQQENYPVDLYFLLDLSYGMVREVEAQERLIALGHDIGTKMKSITNNFRLGFGSFVDKLLMPYSPWTDVMLKNRCPKPDSECRKPHDYRNEVDLGVDEKIFAQKMQEALEDVSQSLDDAEGGLDGVIQALDCDKIGWREVSRRIIVYSSNSLFHLAGAGKLGGATKQSNLKCALDDQGFYKDEKIFDYPSVSQLAHKLREKNANIIFAVMKDVVEDYRHLSAQLDGAVVGELEDDSKNIVELISNKYFELRSRIQFQASNADHVDIKFKSKCLGNVMKETAVCENLEMMDAVEFEVTMSVHEDICEGKVGVVSKDVSINAVGLNEALVVRLNVTCSCECEMPGQEDPNSFKCSDGNGTFECGICECNPGRYGRNCECDQSQISSEESLRKCRMNPNETLTCSGRGDCICGVCECFTLSLVSDLDYSGQFCECNDHSCPDGPHGLCGGSSRGRCSCGKCICVKDKWSGDNCECSLDQTACMATTGTLCNNNGTCNCGKCDCDEGSKWFGPTCEECPNCPSQCSEHFACAQCTEHFPGTLTREECRQQCPNVKDEDELKEGDGVRMCQGTSASDGCTLFFTYEYNDKNEVLIKVQKTKKCPRDAPLAAIIGGTVAAVVLIPLLIICLIIIIRNRRDAKEYADFLNEKNKARWESGVNPMYKDPKSTFQNPTYKGAN
ncbi:integrin beta [Plakobranchus ocellatus]|uniref:Integrin beta n=1 Tax=Plakobranchus ocellatus TaxID=259542 RepID=A0AAV4AVD9_9GAST|nr:integrin beta [Plakobranchus ocellatus]